ncbi:hypothetical protein IM697_29300 [Streptomyces ferrugineus]|uniref:Uncharacterized protein n=1 Tax=Streptomyces ferrugineus TaxID=1413221 RepID=A0A7M2SER1_9ACTN|nr:hypothetical protein [Streptomyces ferrugineus]QOV34225.1 hypothetical protein IM697_29300 [Streptomyces ferrugineus]
MPVQLQAGLISAGVSALILVLGELFLRQRARQEKRQGIQATYQKYSEPLALSSTDLFWRLREVFDTSGAGFYLQGQVHATKFEHYKALSTLYRLAVVLGWIRALRRELFFLPGASRETLKRLDDALHSFTSALAEGGHVETRRVASLMSLWSVGVTPSTEVVTQAGIRIDREQRRFLHEAQAADANQLSDDDQLRLCRAVADMLADVIDCPRIATGIVEETRHRAVSCLAVREAWIYRDWQAAIGDLVLRDAQLGQRQFEVIGYKQFEEMSVNGEEEDRLWLRRLHTVVDDLDVGGDRTRDARIDQLWEIHLATARIIEALHKADAARSRISPATVRAVQEALALAAAGS